MAVARVVAFTGYESEQQHRFECGGCGQPLRVRVRARAEFEIQARGTRREPTCESDRIRKEDSMTIILDILTLAGLAAVLVSLLPDRAFFLGGGHGTDS